MIYIFMNVKHLVLSEIWTYCEGLPLVKLINNLAYGWRVWNLNWPIRIKKAGKAVLSWRQCVTPIQITFCTGNGIEYLPKGSDSKKPYQIVKREKYKTFCVSKLLIQRRNWATRVKQLPRHSWFVECPQVAYNSSVKLNKIFRSSSNSTQNCLY